MAEVPDITQAVERAVAESLDARLAGLREEITRKVLEAIAPALETAQKPAPEEKTGAGGEPTDLLNAAVQSIYDGASQAEILGALLNGASQFSSRVALCVVKGGNASVWQSRGFADQAALKSFSADINQGLISRAVQAHTPASAAAAEFDSNFISVHGNPADGNATVLPLVVREKVPALVYADKGTSPDGHCDTSALHTLVKSASSWLELIALRKNAPAAEAPSQVAETPSAQFAARPEVPATPAPAMAAAAAIPVPSTPIAAPAPAPVVAASAPANSSAAPSLDGLTPEEQEIHKKAKRFAKLLVDEIKLYNQAKVAEGRQNKNLFAVLREDIEKSRSTYEKRYNATPAGNARYFDTELVRILADNDPSLFGPDFPQ